MITAVGGWQRVCGRLPCDLGGPKRLGGSEERDCGGFPRGRGCTERFGGFGVRFRREGFGDERRVLGFRREDFRDQCSRFGHSGSTGRGRFRPHGGVGHDE